MGKENQICNDGITGNCLIMQHWVFQTAQYIKPAGRLLHLKLSHQIKGEKVTSENVLEMGEGQERKRGSQTVMAAQHFYIL